MSRATPDTADALLEELSTPEKAAALMKDPDQWKTLLRDYVKAAIARDPDLMPQLSEAQERGMAEFLRKNGYEPAKRGPGGRLPMNDEAASGVTRGKSRAPGAELDGRFSHFGEFLAKAWHFTQRSGGFDPRLKVLSEASGDAGLFLVPEEFRTEILRQPLEGAVVRPRARVIPMGGPSVRYPAIRDGSHASTVYGGVSASWVAEAGDISSSASEPTFSQVALTAKKLVGYTQTTNELLNDAAISLETMLVQLFGEAIAYFEDDAFLTGVGGSQPVGTLNADALVTVSKETGQAADSIVWENIIKIFARMLPGSLSKAVWVLNIDTFPQLAVMSLAVGTGGAPVWINNGVQGPPATILGRPVIFTEKAETLGDAGDIMFADYSYYLIGDRQMLSVDSSPHVKFTTDQTVWRFIQRVDGRPWVDSALTPRNSSSTLSPFVTLAARA